MLDVAGYRAAELQGRTKFPASWRDTPRLDAFRNSGFPVRVDSLSELGLLLDTMQEGRAGAYRKEMGELSPLDRDLLANATRAQVDFVGAFFQSREPKAAVDTLLAMLALYRKLRSAAPGFKRVLEIGPGCGYLSFFLREHEGLDEYAQIEACESFYLLQHMVNLYCFGSAVRERVTHYAWWEVDQLDNADQGTQFDIVTANACLLECEPRSLERYLKLAARVLPRGGKFVAQCLGHHQHGTPETLDEQFRLHGFNTVYLRGPSPNRCVWNAIWERA